MSRITAELLSMLTAVTLALIVGMNLAPISIPATIVACLVLGIVCGSYLPNKLVKVTARK